MSKSNEALKAAILKVLDDHRAEICVEAGSLSKYNLSEEGLESINKTYAEFDNWFDFLTTQDF